MTGYQPVTNFEVVKENELVRNGYLNENRRPFIGSLYNQKRSSNDNNNSSSMYEQRMEEKKKNVRFNSTILHGLLLLMTIAYEWKDMPVVNCVDSVSGICAMLIPQATSAQDVCSYQVCESFDYLTKNNYNWSKFFDVEYNKSKNNKNKNNNNNDDSLYDSFVSYFFGSLKENNGKDGIEKNNKKLNSIEDVYEKLKLQQQQQFPNMPFIDFNPDNFVNHWLNQATGGYNNFNADTVGTERKQKQQQQQQTNLIHDLETQWTKNNNNNNNNEKNGAVTDSSSVSNKKMDNVPIWLGMYVEDTKQQEQENPIVTNENKIGRAHV